MRLRSTLIAVALLGICLGPVYWSYAQVAAPAAAPAKTEEQEAVGGFVPGQKRPPIDPVVAARGKTLYGVNCQGCHGQDLRGGDMGGPNLLRSQVTLTDQDGEKIVPIIQGGRQAQGMPAIGISVEDSKTVAAYVRSVVGMIGKQGTPPGKEKPLNIVVGSAGEGQKYFAANCAKCHSSGGNLQGIASQITDPKVLQATWLEGVRHSKAGDEPVTQPAAKSTASVTLPDGERVEGTLVRVDDFLVSLKLSDGSARTFRREGEVPKVTISDPLKGHKDLLPVYTDKNIHDVTAYLVTLK